jgi:ribosomal protein L37AE/L43A
LPKDTGAPISLPNYEQIAIDSREERYCPYCDLRLSRIIDSSGMNPNWYCSKCVINYPNKAEAKSKSRLSTPQKSNSERPAVSYPPEPSIGRKKTEIKGGLKALSEKGSIRITSYSESKG